MHHETSQTADSPPPRGVALAAGLLFVVTAATAIAGLAASALHSPRAAWTLFGFEVVVATTAFLGLAYAKAGCRVAPAIGLVSLAGCIAVASYLGYLSVERALGGISLTPFLAARCLIALAIGGLALISALQDDRRAWTTLVIGVVLALPPAAGIGLFIFPRGRPLLDAVANLGGFAASVIGTLLFLVFTASASASVHLVVRSFQTAAERRRAGTGQNP